MKNYSRIKIIFSIALLTFSGPLPKSWAMGGVGTGGGNPMLLSQVDVSSQLLNFAQKIESNHAQVAQSLKKMLKEKRIFAYEGNCKIVEFPDSAQHPRRYWYAKLSDQRVVVDKSLFQLSTEKQLQILTELSLSKREISEKLITTEMSKTGNVAGAIQKIREQVTEPLFQKWIIEAFNNELDKANFFQIPESCFIPANNQSATFLKEGHLIGVRGFTRMTPGANIYFSSEVLSYGELDLTHVIAAELGHHLPIGQEAANEATVDALASVITMGNQSIQSKAIMTDLGAKLLIYNIFARKNIELPNVTEGTEKDTKTKIKGEIPPAIMKLRSFLESEKINRAARSVFNGFNELFGEITMSRLRDCSETYWLYSFVEYDRSVKDEFKRRAPTEMEEIMMNLYGLDRQFCRMVNNVFGKTFIEYGGYGTSYLESAEEKCQEPNTSWQPEPVEGSRISEKKKKKLKELDYRIHSFKKILCEGVNQYSHETPFQGTAAERELILAVVGGDVVKVGKLLQAGVNPNTRDTRMKYNIDYDRNPQDFRVYFREYATSKKENSLLFKTFAHLARVNNEPDQKYSRIIELLLAAGANPETFMESLLSSISSSEPLSSQAEYHYLLLVRKYTKTKLYLGPIMRDFHVCNKELMSILVPISADLNDSDMVRRYFDDDPVRTIGEAKKTCR
ncbi:MAG: hypothetical protein AABY64_06650 [Bdellovibrionota bacterium]